MIVIPGSRALSEFRAQGLLLALQEVCASARAITAEYLHLVDFTAPLSVRQKEVLTALLDYGEAAEPRPEGATLYFVVPRFGTVSPWSSKATEIAQLAGLRNVSRVERGVAFYLESDEPEQLRAIAARLHDRMTETVLADVKSAKALFDAEPPRPLRRVAVNEQGLDALRRANEQWGLALEDDEMDYLVEQFTRLGRDPSDAELMMFAQVNSEHCRHKIFNASWTIDGEEMDDSLFAMIKASHRANPQHTMSAYSDNSAVIRGSSADRFFADPETREYREQREDVHLLMKVETHNHPTAISPWPGAATGSGGEIRDEGATGRGGKPKAGLAGFSVSNLHLPGRLEPWERRYGKPARIASPLEIMVEGPIGAAAFNNEFGRPNLTGYFRVFEQELAGLDGPVVRGYHKPIMIAGGMGNIRADHVDKLPIPSGAPLIVLGGPAMLIGLGGGSASSMATGESDEDLDFASVQRANPEIERRCQEVIDRCWALGADNPILSIHDVGAGGLSNAFPELVHDADQGATFALRDIPCLESSMSPMEIWCNEAQERYVLAVAPDDLARFAELCERERAPYAVVGHATGEQTLLVGDEVFGENPVDLPMDVLFGKPPKMHRTAKRATIRQEEPAMDSMDVREAALAVLRHPSVASKNFLITIGDRSITGQVARDQMVGPYQVPVADVAVTLADYRGYVGEAMAIGERSPLSLLDGPACGRMSVAESLTNLIAAQLGPLDNVRLSANWMAPAGFENNDAVMFDTVRAIGTEFCPALGVSIPVGKDSMSMQSVWTDDAGKEKRVVSPLSLVITAFSPVTDARATLTPELRAASDDGGRLFLVDLGRGANRLGGSIFAQTLSAFGNLAPDVDAETLRRFIAVQQQLLAAGHLVAYHDRSDGGAVTTLAEMCFASRLGVDAALKGRSDHPHGALFSEEIGAILQAKSGSEPAIRQAFAEAGIDDILSDVGAVTDDPSLRIAYNGQTVLAEPLATLLAAWSTVTHELQRVRDNPECAKQEYEGWLSARPPRLHVSESIRDYRPPWVAASAAARPKVAILRDQGVNGQQEMAAAFHQAGFQAIDVHMTDVLAGRVALDEFRGLVACGGFSYGDVLGAGGGWAKTAYFNPTARQEFARFFERDDTFTLGVCNGCQMLSVLKDLIPGADHWPRFLRNRSEQFEARLVTVRIEPSPSLFFEGMSGWELPIAVAHGEGRAALAAETAGAVEGVAVRYIEDDGAPAERYPRNPNGSPSGATGFTSRDGRATILMPHPERVFRTVQCSWHPPSWGEYSPWMEMFLNARRWCDAG